MKLEEIIRLNEGTWSSPNTIDAALELIELLKNPLPAGNAARALYNLLGNDSLFDSIEDVTNKDGPETDVRFLVKDYLRNMLKNLDINDWNVEWDADAISILQTEL